MRRPFSQTSKARWDKFGLTPGNFVALGHVSDHELVALYKAASVLIQPSLMEGFGLTALEAMMCGTPVIASTQGALPEVIANPELMFDPRRFSGHCGPASLGSFEIAEFTSQVVARGLEQARQFTWKKSAAISDECADRNSQSSRRRHESRA